MSSRVIDIDWNCVDDLAKSIAELPRAQDFAHRVIRNVAADDEDCSRAFLWAAAICHATHGGLRGTRGAALYNGWDYLLEAFSSWAEQNPTRISPDAIGNVTEAVLRDLLTAPFEEATIALSDLERRATILRDVAHGLVASYDGSVTRLLEAADQRVDGESGAYARLRLLPGFADPLDKKSSAFLMALHFSGRWRPVDQDKVRPMIDYHRMRVLLRTGCLVPASEEVAEHLRARTEVSGVVADAIRDAAMKVCSAIPARVGVDVFDFDVLLWALARSCCRNRPLCVSEGPENESFYLFTGLPETTGCVLAAICPGARSASTRGFWEPAVLTEDY